MKKQNANDKGSTVKSVAKNNKSEIKTEVIIIKL